ncbi:hypothetical protein [Geodermatophilus sp. URMC 63]
MSRRFEGKTAIIAGASRSSGLSIAERAVADRAWVVITGRGEALDGADRLVALLLSVDAGWLTGHTVVIDGGVTLTGGVE